MKRLITTLILSASSCVFAAPNLISMVGSNAVDNELPMGVFEGKAFRALQDARFVKLHIYPDKPLKGVDYIEIEACDKWMAPTNGQQKESAYINFDEITSANRDWEEYWVSFEQKSPKVLKISYTSADEEKTIPFIDIESLTINFGPQKKVCIQSVKFFNAKKKQIPIQVPLMVSGSVTASSVQLPVEAYATEKMFDSKFENAWATNKVSGGAALTFKFETDTKIEKIKIWNGYQRSVTHCQQNSRVKTLELKGDGDYSATIKVADKLGSQEIVLPKAFSGKNLTITVKDAIKGKTYEDLAITELRFFDGKNWFFLNPINHIKDLNKKIRDQFTQAKLSEMLNDEFKTPGEMGNWTYRFRSDGSMYIQGYVPGEEEGTAYSALGNFEIKSIGADLVQLRIFGFLYKSKFGMDCNGCGVACNSPDKQDGTSQRIFQQNITLKAKLKDGKLEQVEVINDTKSPQLKFTKMNIEKTKEPKW